MKRGVKMAVMALREDGKRRMTEPMGNYPRYDHDGTRMDYDYPRMNYPVYSAHPEYEWETTNNGDTEARFRDRRGREHYDSGRYAPKSEYPYTPLVPPVYRGDDMNRIGFEHPMDANYPRMDEMSHRTSGMTMGHAKGTDMVLTEEMAEEWMHGLHNEDGTKGPHWTKEQTTQVMKQKGIKTDPLDFYVVMNALYADYCSVLKKHNVNNIDFYTDLSAAWLNDKDAQEGKTARYFQYIAK